MVVKICTPVTGKKLDDFLFNLEKIQKVSDCIELRVDYIENLTQKDVENIRHNTFKEAIFTCRAHHEGGNFSEPEEKRKEIIQHANDLKFNYIDIEYSSIDELNFQKQSTTKLILSYHNFKETPHYWEMQKMIFDMQQKGADIVKVATYINENYDTIKLMRLVVNKKFDEKRIIVGMGDKSRNMRIIAPLLGSYLTFASTSYSQSAPGQIDLHELQTIYNSFNLSL